MKKASHKGESSTGLPPRPLLIVLSGPSGAGKDAILSRMKKSGAPIEFITTVTTRPKRAKEKNNVDYHFGGLNIHQKLSWMGTGLSLGESILEIAFLCLFKEAITVRGTAVV